MLQSKQLAPLANIAAPAIRLGNVAMVASRLD
jgi:hypothetical protein